MHSRVFDKWAKALIVLVVIAVFGSMAYAYFSARYRAVVADQASNLERIANNLEQHFSGRLMALKVVASDPDVRNLNAKVEEDLIYAMNALGCFGIALADLDGNIIVDPTGIQPDKVRDVDSFDKVVKGQPVISNRIVPDIIDNAFISLRVPVYNDKGQMRAALIAGVPLTHLERVFSEPAKSDAQYIYVIDGNGNLVYHPRLKELYPEKPGLIQRGKQVLLPQRSGYIVDRSVLDNSEKLYVFTKVNNTDWRIVMATPLMNVYAIVLRESMPDMVIFGLLVTCFGLLGARLRQARKYEELQENVRLERLTSVNQLAAGIAHEIRNPLTSIKGFIQLILAKGDRPAPKSYLEIALAEIERIEKLIKEFHLLARPLQEPKLEKIDVASSVQDVALLMESQALAKSVALELEIEQPALVWGDAAQLKQVWINLLRNAIEAVEKGGCIHIRVSIQKNSASVAIEDNGPGIPEHVLAQMGTPFFTTKEDGTGLGLSVCYSIIQHHGGQIKVNSNMGVGTTFTVLLPMLEEAPPVAELINCIIRQK